MTGVPVSIWVTEGMLVVSDISPGGAVGIGMDKICGGSVDNIKFMYHNVSMAGDYKCCKYYAMYNYYLQCNDTVLNSVTYIIKHKHTLNESAGSQG